MPKKLQVSHVSLLKKHGFSGGNLGLLGVRNPAIQGAEGKPCCSNAPAWPSTPGASPVPHSGPLKAGRSWEVQLRSSWISPTLWVVMSQTSHGTVRVLHLCPIFPRDDHFWFRGNMTRSSFNAHQPTTGFSLAECFCSDPPTPQPFKVLGSGPS